MNIELRKWSVEDKEVLIKMCNSIDRSFLSDRLPNPYTNASAEWWLTMVKDNEGKKGVFRGKPLCLLMNRLLNGKTKMEPFMKDSLKDGKMKY